MVEKDAQVTGIAKNQVFILCDDLGVTSQACVSLLCFLKSRVITAVNQENFRAFHYRPADKLYRDSDIIFQQDLKKLARLEPPSETIGYYRGKMRDTEPSNADTLKATIKAT